MKLNRKTIRHQRWSCIGRNVFYCHWSGSLLREVVNSYWESISLRWCSVVRLRGKHFGACLFSYVTFNYHLDLGTSDLTTWRSYRSDLSHPGQPGLKPTLHSLYSLPKIAILSSAFLFSSKTLPWTQELSQRNYVV